MENEEYTKMLCGSELSSLSDDTGAVSSDISVAVKREMENRDDINSLIVQ